MVTDAKYEALLSRMRDLLASVSGQVSKETIEIVASLIEANECPIALDLLSEMLVESRGRISGETFTAFRELAEYFDIGETTSDRLRGLVTEPGS